MDAATNVLSYNQHTTRLAKILFYCCNLQE